MFDKIRESNKYVIENSKNVKINYDVIDKYINDMDLNKVKFWLASNPYNLLDLDIETIINFILVFESIDYSFWGDNKWSICMEDGILDGSIALLYCLLSYVKKTHNTDFSKLSFKEFSDILKGNSEIPLLKERYNTVYEISKIVNEKMNGSFYQYIKDITDDTKLFDVIVSNFPSFRDERSYNGKTIYFYKLAQLVVSDILHIREMKEEISVDYSHLVGCADYKIPQTMRALEMVEYSENLNKLVDNKKELDINSIYEVEIRASVIVVIDYISKKLVNEKKIDINDYFFLLAKQVKDKVKPYHLVRNTNY